MPRHVEQFSEHRESGKPAVGNSKTRQRGQNKSFLRLRAFHQACGHTPGCLACDTPETCHHTQLCMDKQLAWDLQCNALPESQTMDATAGPGESVTVDVQDDSSQPMEVTESGQKRPAETQLEPEEPTLEPS